MRALVAVTLAAVAIGILGARAHADAQATKLVGTVDDAATISLKHEDGTLVTTLAPGSYDVEVTDSTGGHNFHLSGPGTDETTGIAEQGTFTWPLTFGEGGYHYVCDVHALTMIGHFSVATASPPPPPTPPPPGPPPPAPPAPPAPPPPPPIEHPPPVRAPAATVSRLSVRVAPGRVLVATVQAGAATRAALELRRGVRRVQAQSVSLKRGRNVLRMRIRKSVRAGSYLVVVRTSAGRLVSHRLRLR
jgi:plastocyanin